MKAILVKLLISFLLLLCCFDDAMVKTKSRYRGRSRGRNRYKNKHKHRGQSKKHTYTDSENESSYGLTCNNSEKGSCNEKRSNLIDYDMYIFALDWSPASCFNLKGRAREVCANKFDKVEKLIFSIHGVWPSFTSHYNEERCNKGRSVVINGETFAGEGTLLAQMDKYWVSNQFSNYAFWSHEYNKHGFCYTLRNLTDKNQPVEYFKFVLSNYLSKSLADLIKNEVLKSKTYEDGEMKFVSFEYTFLDNLLSEKLKTSFSLRCVRSQNKQFLKEIFIFYSVDMNEIDYTRKSSCNDNQEVLVLLA